MKTRITDRYLKTMTLPAVGRMRMDYDTDLRGFAVRVTGAGSKTFVLTYMFRRNTDRRVTMSRRFKSPNDEIRHSAARG